MDRRCTYRDGYVLSPRKRRSRNISNCEVAFGTLVTALWRRSLGGDAHFDGLGVAGGREGKGGGED